MNLFDGYTPLRPVLRINSEIRNNKELYLELNTPVEAYGRRMPCGECRCNSLQTGPWCVYSYIQKDTPAIDREETS